MNNKSVPKAPEPEKIIEALHVLQDTCNTYYCDYPEEGLGSCDKCPLNTKVADGVYICTVSDLIPSNWDIGEVPAATWNAFK